MSSNKRSWVSLHTHSDYSMLDGAARIDDLLVECVRMGMPALAITDHGNMFGAYELWSKARKCGINPIVGMEAYLAPKSRHDRKKVSLVDGSEPIAYTHITLLAETTAGMHNLFRLSSLASLEGSYHKPRCLLPGQEIMTRRGSQKIENIRIGDEVLTHRGRFRPVTGVTKNAYDGELYGIQLSGRYRRVTWMTGEHPVLIRRRNGDKHWIEACRIAGGRPGTGTREAVDCWNSWVCLPRVRSDSTPLAEIRTADYVSWTPTPSDPNRFFRTSARRGMGPTNHYANFPAVIPLDFDFGFLIGLYLSEGHILRSQEVSWSFHQDETELIDFCQKMTERLVGRKATVDHRMDRPDYKGVSVRSSSALLSQLLHSLCDSGRCHKLHMPDFVFEAPESFMDGLFRGVLAGDGSKTRSEVIALNVTSEQLHWQMRTLAARLRSDFSGTYCGPVASDKHSQQYLSYFSPDHELQHRRTASDRDFVYKPIKEVLRRPYDGFVYNIAIKEDHSYVTDFAVHNCDRELLAQYSTGIIATTGCPGGEVPRLLQSGRFDAACQAASDYRDIFGPDNYFLELMDHGLDIERSTREDLVRLKNKLGLPGLATNDLHYTYAKDTKSHDVLLCIQTGARVSDAQRFRFESEEFYLKSPAQMRALFDSEFPEACDNSLRIAERVSVEFTEGRRDLMPRFAVSANGVMTR